MDCAAKGMAMGGACAPGFPRGGVRIVDGGGRATSACLKAGRKWAAAVVFRHGTFGMKKSTWHPMTGRKVL